MPPKTGPKSIQKTNALKKVEVKVLRHTQWHKDMYLNQVFYRPLIELVVFQGRLLDKRNASNFNDNEAKGAKIKQGLIVPRIQ